jgi:S-adenosylmethionine/arginine decarboxylase-like enzyme
MAYGKELIIDLYDCNVSLFNREDLEVFLKELCDRIHMKREDLHFWDYEECPEEKEKAPVHLDGTSAVQFIKTSNITIHTLDKVGECYINLFSCKDYKAFDAATFIREWFGASKSSWQIIERGIYTKCQMSK